MADAVAICNLALSYIGDSASISSIDPPDETATAQMCATMYPFAVSSLLERFDWSFATRYAELAPYADAESRGWRNVYAVPSDCMRAIRVRSKSALHWPQPKGARYEIALDNGHTVLFTDVESPILYYITSNVNPALFSQNFSVALSWYLAVMLVGQRVKGREGFTMSQNLTSQFERALAEAKRLDASQQKKSMLFTPRQIEVR